MKRRKLADVFKMYVRHVLKPYVPYVIWSLFKRDSKIVRKW